MGYCGIKFLRPPPRLRGNDIKIKCLKISARRARRAVAENNIISLIIQGYDQALVHGTVATNKILVCSYKEVSNTIENRKYITRKEKSITTVIKKND